MQGWRLEALAIAGAQGRGSAVGAIYGIGRERGLAAEPVVMIVASTRSRREARDRCDADLAIKAFKRCARVRRNRSEEHTYELQSLMRISHAVFCLKNHTIT